MTESTPSPTDDILRLHDGRALGMAWVGKNKGFPIFYFHGHGSSRLEVLLWAEWATRLGVWLIALDRPGIGRSDLKADYRLLDWPNDVVEVAEGLGIERFAVQAVSGGGAYGLACAYALPHRLTGCGLISSIAPGYLITKDVPLWMRVTWWWMGKHVPWLSRLFASLEVRALGSDAARIEKQLLRASRFFSEPDRKLLQNAKIRRLLAQAIAECVRQGAQGYLDEQMRLVEPWGFNLQEITFEKIFLWHGEQDRFLPLSVAQALAQALPHCTATFYSNEGHLSTANYAEDILRTLSS